jgi:cellulose synthase/poly-beta-1,6-N-acetylglucosamine synthase-like glycosyltransferase
MIVLETIITVFFWLIGIYLLFNCCYILFFALAGLKKINWKKTPANSYRKFCILIPAYKEDAVILETSKAALSHAYNGLFDVYVVADSLKSQTICELKESKVKVIEVSFEKSTKGKALSMALDRLPQNMYDVALVLDGDNHMGRNLLEEINIAFEAGYKVVQAHRTAKNMDTPFALLDACNEEINNHFLRKGHFAIGMSSALIGSGMAFEYTYLKKLLIGIGETVGEDKEIDLRIAKDKIKICYLDKAYVYDEKIENAAVFTRQRTRWISAQIDFLTTHFREGFRELFINKNFDFFNKILQALLLPRILLVGLLGFLAVFSLIISVGLPFTYWLSLLATVCFALLISLPSRFYNKNLVEAILNLPIAFFCMCKALLGINKTKTSFLATPHNSKVVSSQYID